MSKGPCLTFSEPYILKKGKALDSRLQFLSPPPRQSHLCVCVGHFSSQKTILLGELIKTRIESVKFMLGRTGNFVKEKVVTFFCFHVVCTILSNWFFKMISERNLLELLDVDSNIVVCHCCQYPWLHANSNSASAALPVTNSKHFRGLIHFFTSAYSFLLLFLIVVVLIPEATLHQAFPVLDKFPVTWLKMVPSLFF